MKKERGRKQAAYDRIEEKRRGGIEKRMKCIDTKEKGVRSLAYLECAG